jgi:DNA-binding transcriptional LysR family regulator
MEIQQLRHFLAVSRYGSIGQAAEVLNLSQPGLSRSIRALEDMLGLALFERQARGVALTDHGRQLLRRAELIVNEHDRAIADARSAGSLRSGDVRLGLHDVAQGIGAIGALGGFLDANPTIGLSIDVTAGATLVDRVALADLDVAFTLFPPDRKGSEVHFERLFELPCHIYQRRNCARSIQGIKSFAELLDRHWVLSGGMNFRTVFEERLARLGLSPPALFLQSSSLALTLELVLSRDVLTILPARVAQSPALAGKLERCDVQPPGGLPSGGLIYRREALRIPAVAAVAECFRNFSAQFQSV